MSMRRKGIRKQTSIYRGNYFRSNGRGYYKQGKYSKLFSDFPGRYLKKLQAILPRKNEYYQGQATDLQLRLIVPPWHIYLVPTA